MENNRKAVVSSRIFAVVPFLLILILWGVLTGTGIIGRIFLPAPGKVLISFIKLLSSSFLLQHLVPSILRVSCAFLISVIIAFPLGVLIGRFSMIAHLLEPIFGFTRYLPVASLVPLCILWFGISHSQKIAVILIGVVFQLVLLFADDFATVPIELIESGRTFGLDTFQVIKKIVIPWAMPAIWDDMRISAGWAWSYLVLAELIAGNRGVGYFIIQSQRYLETENVFAGILFIGILGVITDILFRISRFKIFRWQ